MASFIVRIPVVVYRVGDDPHVQPHGAHGIDIPVDAEDEDEALALASLMLAMERIAAAARS